MTRIRNLRGVAVAMACIGTLLAAPTAAMAMTTHSATTSLGARGAGDQPQQSPDFAGWQIAGSYTHVRMSSTFVAPRLKCGTVNRAILPSIGIFTTPSPSNKFSGADMVMGCFKGQAHYWPSLVLNNRVKTYRTGASAHPGDTIILKVFINSTRTVVTTLDNATKVKRTMTGPGSTTLAYPAVGEDGWGDKSQGLWGVPDFGHITFSRTVISGDAFGSAPGLIQWDRYKGSTLQIKTSSFASDQETFKTVFKHS